MRQRPNALDSAIRRPLHDASAHVLWRFSLLLLTFLLTVGAIKLFMRTPAGGSAAVMTTILSILAFSLGTSGPLLEQLRTGNL